MAAEITVTCSRPCTSTILKVTNRGFPSKAPLHLCYLTANPLSGCLLKGIVWLLYSNTTALTTVPSVFSRANAGPILLFLIYTIFAHSFRTCK
jgi:hypothetical protein